MSGKITIEEFLSDKDRISLIMKDVQYQPQSIEQNEKSIQDLKNAYNKGDLVLALGAGVSFDFGLPSWKLLLQNLMVSTIDESEKASNILANLFTEIFNPNPIIAGRYLQQHFKNENSNFEKEVYHMLYQNSNFDFDSKLMKEIVTFCVAPNDNPKIDSIISYNFDNILEYKLDNLEFPIKYKSIYKKGMNVSNNELPIYHVHGFLPQNNLNENVGQITFGENVYHKQYKDTYSWNNITQINKFRDKTCIFLGTSLTDPNVRRLLDIAQQHKGTEKIDHFVIKRKYHHTHTRKLLEKIINQNHELRNEKRKESMYIDETADMLIQLITKFEEKDSASFGVKTIWVNEYSEISSILEQLREI